MWSLKTCWLTSLLKLLGEIICATLHPSWAWYISMRKLEGVLRERYVVLLVEGRLDNALASIHTIWCYSSYPNLTPLQLLFSFRKKNLAFIFWSKGRSGAVKERLWKTLDQRRSERRVWLLPWKKTCCSFFRTSLIFEVQIAIQAHKKLLSATTSAKAIYYLKQIRWGSKEWS